MGIRPIQKENEIQNLQEQCNVGSTIWTECWKVNQNDGQRLNTFHNRCLHQILRIFWPRTISNKKLYEEVEISRITDIISSRLDDGVLLAISFGLRIQMTAV